MTTAIDLIHASLRLLQVKSPDVALTAEEANDALEALNMMLDGWSNESLMAYHIVTESFTLTPGQSAYTIGTGGDFDTDRPIAIDAATITISGVDWPIESMAYDDWAAIKQKTVSTYPEYLYLDQAYPLSILKFYPVPGAADTVTLYSRKPFTQFPNLTTALSLPSGYARAIKYGLAIELAPEYQTSVNNDIKRIYTEAKASIKRTNQRAITSQIDPALLCGRKTRFNINRGE